MEDDKDTEGGGGVDVSVVDSVEQAVEVELHGVLCESFIELYVESVAVSAIAKCGESYYLVISSGALAGLTSSVIDPYLLDESDIIRARVKLSNGSSFSGDGFRVRNPKPDILILISQLVKNIISINLYKAVEERRGPLYTDSIERGVRVYEFHPEHDSSDSG